MGLFLLVLLLLQKPDYYADGMKALESQKYQDAAQLFAKAVEADPKDYAAHFHLALSYSLIDRDNDAISEYQKVLALRPGLYEAELNIGIVLLREKRASEALPRLQAAAEQKPKEFRPLFYLAEALFAAGDFAKAEERYKAAAELDAKSAGAELGWGRSLARQNRLADATEHYNKAAALDRSFDDALLELAALYEAQKQAAPAIAIYQRFPENVAAQERLGELLLESGQPAEAIPPLELVVRKSPTAASRLALATAYLRNKQLDKALPLLEQSVATAPDNFDLRLMYGRALRDQKSYAPAAREFVRATQLKPGSQEAWSELAGMLILLENYPQALAALDRLRALGVDNAAQYFFRAIILDKTGQDKLALESYDKFLAMSQGQNPNEEFQARQRARIIRKKLSKR